MKNKKTLKEKIRFYLGFGFLFESLSNIFRPRSMVEKATTEKKLKKYKRKLIRRGIFWGIISICLMLTPALAPFIAGLTLASITTILQIYRWSKIKKEYNELQEKLENIRKKNLNPELEIEDEKPLHDKSLDLNKENNIGTTEIEKNSEPVKTEEEKLENAPEPAKDVSETQEEQNKEDNIETPEISSDSKPVKTEEEKQVNISEVQSEQPKVIISNKTYNEILKEIYELTIEFRKNIYKDMYALEFIPNLSNDNSESFSKTLSK